VLKAIILKLPLLLTQFLYKHKKLNLPGIGSFTLDPDAIIPDEHSKDIHALAMGISFKNAVIHHADNELIEFIRLNTGKIRPLAISDLESYLTLGNELLNIGKPFYLEGIGTLTKNQDGSFEFAPGEYATTRLEDLSLERPERASKHKYVSEDTHYEHEVQPNKSRKLVIALAIIGGLVVVGWGSYLLLKKNASRPTETSLVPMDTVTKAVDTTGNAVRLADSLARENASQSQQALPGEKVPYKFIILRTHNKEHALKRYAQLQSYSLKVNLETKDSLYFKVYFPFPAFSKDTLHIKDSLRREYAHDVIIER
jgi:hypothetical protein